jgi:hypothetical protein
MTGPSELDFILDSLDRITFSRPKSVLAKLIVENLRPLSDLEERTLLLSKVECDDLQILSTLNEIWKDFEDLDGFGQARRRLLVGIIGPQEKLDLHSGSYLVDFALKAGMNPAVLTGLLRGFVETYGARSPD